MERLNKFLAHLLLDINAIKLQPSLPFTLRSGWQSPIYNDHRRAMSYPKVRNYIKSRMALSVMSQFSKADAIASVSEGAIAIGALVADVLNLPFVYVRSTPKDHGLENLIEGNLKPKQNVVVIEDLVSSGANSVKGIEIIRNAGCEVLGMISLFSFDFAEALDLFRINKVPFIALTDYHIVVNEAFELGKVSAEEVETMRQWHADPQNWLPKDVSMLE